MYKSIRICKLLKSRCYFLLLRNTGNPEISLIAIREIKEKDIQNFDDSLIFSRDFVINKAQNFLWVSIYSFSIFYIYKMHKACLYFG